MGGNNRTQSRKRQETQYRHLRSVWSRPIEPEIRLIAIDPGDVYTGVAFFTTDENGHWYCADAQEFSPADFEDALAEYLFDNRHVEPPIIVYERWRLYADHAQEKTGDEFLAAQHIGVIKYVVRVNNDHYDRHVAAEAQGKMMSCELKGRMCADPANRPRQITIVKQGAEIKKPTAGILRHKKIKSVAKPIAKELYKNRDHVIDAELHGWKHILDTMKGTAAL